MSDIYDVIVIGSGPAGYVAAIRASQLGLKTLCIEKFGTENTPDLGGTCLNVGCIPSKTLLESSYKYAQAKSLDVHGVIYKDLSFDLTTMQARKDKIVQNLTNGVDSLFKLNKVESLQGHASLISKEKVRVIFDDGSARELDTKNIIIATGSKPINLTNIGDGKENIVSSKESLSFSEVPKELAVIGAGVIGLELASIWTRLGSNVTILEAANNFLPSVDKSISRQALKIFQKQGLDIQLDSNVLEADSSNDQVKIKYHHGSIEKELLVDKLIVAVGRRPLIEGLFLEELDIGLDDSGHIKVNDFCQTKVSNVYAVGDVVRGPMLAHKASEEGIMVAERIAGKEVQVNYMTIPSVIYTHPEIAWAGITEEQAIEKNIDVSVGSFPFLVSGRAMASGDTEGMVKVIINKTNDLILGIHVMGNSAADIVQQGVIVMNSEIKAEDISETVFSHPSLSEALHEAILSAKGKAIHINNRKKR
jgi:dihydrolipoamide dehydrogenase|tara:strand:+ start:1751 stop:3181 length:1431 start_codon:yes stop_codon:yes gene_type:complete